MTNRIGLTACARIAPLMLFVALATVSRSTTADMRRP